MTIWDMILSMWWVIPLVFIFVPPTRPIFKFILVLVLVVIGLNSKQAWDD